MASSNRSNGSLDWAGLLFSAMVMFPTTERNYGRLLHLLLALVDVQEPLRRWLKSHTEWAQKTATGGANGEISWYD
jgi:hypothetical protein